MDWEKLTNDIVAVTTATVSSLLSKHADEHFYAFALYTDEDASTVLLSANSIEQYDAKVRRLGETDPSDLAAYRWATAEWAYENWEGELFTGIYRDLEAYRRTLPGETPADIERYRRMSPAEISALPGPNDDPAYVAYKTSVHACMIEALERARRDGLFAGQGEDVVLFVSSSDDDESFDLENRSARRLNPDRIFTPFLNRYP